MTGWGEVAAVSAPEALVALAGAGVGLGLTLIVAGLWSADGPADTLPPARRERLPAVAAQPRGAAWWRHVAVAVGAGVLAGWWTGWPVAALLVGAGCWWLPGLLGPDREHHAAVAKIEAVAGWAEQLRDTLAAASGLEQAIATTAGTAPDVVRPVVAALAARLHAGERLPVALAHAGRDFADPTADLVIAALSMAARQQARQLTDLLAALAGAAREDAAGRMRTAVARAQVRTSVRVIVGATLALIVLLAVLNPAYLSPYGTIEGQLVLAAVGGLFAVAFWWLARIARPRVVPRLIATDGSR